MSAFRKELQSFAFIWLLIEATTILMYNHWIHIVAERWWLSLHIFCGGVANVAGNARQSCI